MLKLENILIAFYGITTVIVFILMITFGGLFDSLQTVLFREVSYLISPYTFKNEITVPLYQIYNFHLLMFSLVLFLRMKNTFAKLGALYLSMSAVTSFLLTRFPMDPQGIAQSLSGTTHLLVATVTAFYLAVALFLFSYGFKKNKHLVFLSIYSFEICLLLLFAGFLTGIVALLNLPTYVGLIQKLPIAAFLIWILLTAIGMINSDSRIKYCKRMGIKC